MCLKQKIENNCVFLVINIFCNAGRSGKSVSGVGRCPGKLTLTV